MHSCIIYLYSKCTLLCKIFVGCKFHESLKVDCLCLYFRECMEAISLGSQAKKYGVVLFTCLLNNVCCIPYSMKLGAISKADSEVYRLESCPSAC